MKRVIFCMLALVLVTGANVSFAQLTQRERIDSLEKVFNSDAYKSKADTDKAALLIYLGNEHVNPDTQLIYMQQAYDLLKDQHSESRIADAAQHMGRIYYTKSDYANALKYSLEALRVYEKLDNKESISITLRTIGHVYYWSEDIPNALQYYNRALKIGEQLNDTVQMCQALGNIGNCYLQLKDRKKALEYQEKSLQLAEKIRHGKFITMILTNIGLIHQNNTQPDYSMAFSYYFRALESAKSDTHTVATIIGNIGSLYLTSVARDTLNNVPPGKHMPASKQERLKLAITYLQKAIDIQYYMGDVDAQSYYYERLASAYQLSGNTEEAYRAYKKFIELRDSVFSINNQKEMIRHQMQYEYDKKEALAKAEQEKKTFKQTIIRNFSLSGLGAMIIFSTVVMRQRNKVKKQKAAVEVEKARGEELLLNILPGKVAEELKSKGYADAQQINNVSVLFTDFKGFTRVSEKLSPTQLVAELNTCFSTFDLIMQKYGIEKIKTIGDAYMAVGGLPTPNTTHAVDVVQAALEIRDYMHRHMQEKKAKGEVFFEIRIGVHSGPVVAGIVGIKKFSYDIWGDTVNTANCMESSGKEGRVNISQATYDLVKDKFDCEYRGEVAAKNKGMLKMYYVNSEKV